MAGSDLHLLPLRSVIFGLLCRGLGRVTPPQTHTQTKKHTCTHTPPLTHPDMSTGSSQNAKAERREANQRHRRSLKDSLGTSPRCTCQHFGIRTFLLDSSFCPINWFRCAWPFLCVSAPRKLLTVSRRHTFFRFPFHILLLLFLGMSRRCAFFSFWDGSPSSWWTDVTG